MSVKDLANQISATVTVFITVSEDGEFPQASFDTADFGEGVATFCNVANYVDGVYSLSYDESSDNGVSDPWTRVPDEKLIMPPGTSPAEANTGEFLPRIGVFGNKRFVRPVIIATDVTTGAQIVCISVLAGEYVPIPNPENNP